MRICFLSSLHPPTDKRVFEKEAVSLAAAGFEVVHLATGPNTDSVKKGVRILTEPALSGLAGRILNGPKLLLRAWKQHADCYHCNEVDSWMIGVILKLLTGCRIVFDAHEAYPEEFAEGRFPKPIQPLVTASVRILLRILLPITDKVVLAKESVAGDYPDPSKRVLVRNYVSVNYARQNAVIDERSERAGRIRVIHLGLISRARGWSEMVTCLSSDSTCCELLFVGEFNDGSEPAFRARIAKLGLEDRVTVLPWMPFEDAFRMVRSSHVGIVAFQPGRHNHVHALPHKMFDYMVAGIPVIVPSFAVEIAHIVRDADCGLLVDSADPASIGEALAYLASRPDERVRLGENGRKAVLSSLNWEAEAQKLEHMYREFAEGCEPARSRRQSARIEE